MLLLYRKPANQFSDSLFFWIYNRTKIVPQNRTSIFATAVSPLRKRRPAIIVEVEAENMLDIYICSESVFVAVILLTCWNLSSRKPSTPLHQIDCGHSVIYQCQRKLIMEDITRQTKVKKKDLSWEMRNKYEEVILL